MWLRHYQGASPTNHKQHQKPKSGSAILDVILGALASWATCEQVAQRNAQPSSTLLCVLKGMASMKRSFGVAGFERPRRRRRKGAVSCYQRACTSNWAHAIENDLGSSGGPTARGLRVPVGREGNGFGPHTEDRLILLRKTADVKFAHVAAGALHTSTSRRCDHGTVSVKRPSRLSLAPRCEALSLQCLLTVKQCAL